MAGWRRPASRLAVRSTRSNMQKAIVLALTVLASSAVPGTEVTHEKGLEGSLVACPADEASIGDVPSCGKIGGWVGLRLVGSNGDRGGGEGPHAQRHFHGRGQRDAGRVDGVAAAVVCPTSSGGSVAAGGVVALSKEGNAKIRAHVNLPGSIAPVIVLRERYGGKVGGWLAATGYSSCPALKPSPACGRGSHPLIHHVQPRLENIEFQ